MREIVLDTETTGLDPDDGHRVVEIAAVELVNHVQTGRHWHCYLNPERDMPEGAYRVHGLSAEFLAGHRCFHEEVEAFLGFLGDAPLVIHNAEFDAKFLNAELGRCGRNLIVRERLVDTLEIARRRFPNAPNSLDALCRRFSIDLSGREKHGALIDCQLLAEVYLELIGGRQPGLALVAEGGPAEIRVARVRVPRAPRPHAPTPEELAAHEAFIAGIKDALWRQ